MNDKWFILCARSEPTDTTTKRINFVCPNCSFTLEAMPDDRVVMEGKYPCPNDGTMVQRES